jgi:hypothetical protein
MPKKINKNKVVKKQKKNEKKSKQKQKQKQTVNVKVNIDQSKRTAPRAAPQSKPVIHSGNANTPLHTVIQQAQPYPFNMYQPFHPPPQDNSFKDNFQAYGNRLDELSDEVDRQRYLLTNNSNPKQLYKLLMNEHQNQINNSNDDGSDGFKSNNDVNETNEFEDNHTPSKNDFIEDAHDKGDVPVKRGRGRPKLTEDQAQARLNDKETDKMRRINIKEIKRKHKEDENIRIQKEREAKRELKRQNEKKSKIKEYLNNTSTKPTIKKKRLIILDEVAPDEAA